MNTQDKLIDVKDLSLATSAIMTKVYDDNLGLKQQIDSTTDWVAYLHNRIENLPSPMVFKGSLGTGGTITSLPTASTDNEGYTYKVITAGTYASQAAKIGDMFISDGSTWVYVPSADEPSGTVTSVTLKATSPIAIDSSSAITTSGTRTISHGNSGVTAGTYRSVTVNATGHVTTGTNPTTLSGYGITDAKIADGVITLGSNTITPLTSSSTLDATKVSGTLPTSTYTNTKNTAGSTNSSNKLFLIGATSQAANPQTYSHDTAYVGTDGKLYSNSKEVVNLSDTQALTNKTYNGYTLAAASAKAVDTSITAASTSANLPTSAAVASFVEGKGYLTNYTETDPIYSASAAATISSSDITNWNNKVDTTDYATSSTAGVVKTGYQFLLNASGVPYANNVTYANYESLHQNSFISKGTLENVITGKNLVTLDDIVKPTATDLLSGSVSTITNNGAIDLKAEMPTPVDPTTGTGGDYATTGEVLVDYNGTHITGLVDPTEDTDAVNKKYVGNISSLETTDKANVVSAINENTNRLNDLVYTENVNLATNMTIAANTAPATQTYTLSPKSGYTPIFVALENTWGGQVTLWYCTLNGNTISWRVRNNTSGQLTGFTIRVRVLYIKSESFLGLF